MNTKKEMVPLTMDKNDLYWIVGGLGAARKNWDKGHERQSEKVIKRIYEAINEYDNKQ